MLCIFCIRLKGELFSVYGVGCSYLVTVFMPYFMHISIILNRLTLHSLVLLFSVEPASELTGTAII